MYLGSAWKGSTGEKKLFQLILWVIKQETTAHASAWSTSSYNTSCVAWQVNSWMSILLFALQCQTHIKSGWCVRTRGKKIATHFFSSGDKCKYHCDSEETKPPADYNASYDVKKRLEMTFFKERAMGRWRGEGLHVQSIKEDIFPARKVENISGCYNLKKKIMKL